MLTEAKDKWKPCDYCNNDTYNIKRYMLELIHGGHTTICENCLNNLKKEIKTLDKD